MIGRISDGDTPMPIFDQLSLNCKYKPLIRHQTQLSNSLLKELEELLDRYAKLKKELDKIVKIAYKFVSGDEIDRLFGEALIRRGCTVETKRISAGIYMFGTRQIIAKIVNNKLMIRVGGGFMTIDEFITQYGPIEMLKYQQAVEVKENGGRMPKNGRNAMSPSKQFAMNIAKMRKTIKVGLNEGSFDNSQDASAGNSS